MNWFFNKPKKISWKLTLVYTIIFMLVLIILNTSVYFILQKFINNTIKENIDNTLNYILPKIRGVDERSFDQYDADFLNDISRSEGNVYFRILDYNQNIIAQSNHIKNLNIPLDTDYSKIDAGDNEYVAKTVIISKYGFLNGYLQVVRDTTVEKEFMERLMILLIAAGIIGSVGALIIGYLITKKSMQPVKNMSSTARQITASDLGRRLKISDAEDELSDLARTFNSMLDRLEDSFKRQREFVSDASHELRTPISVIKGYINLLDRWGKDNDEIREEAITAIKEEADHMDKLIESLLFLARGDIENIEVVKETFYLDKVVKRICDEMSMINDNINIECRVNDGIEFKGDKKLIIQLLRIFLDNSIKYTPKGGKIIVSVTHKNKNIILEIEDTGQGIPENEIPHIFERFYRVDKSRNSNNGGTGLGLAIAKEIIDIHEGDVEVISKKNEGTKTKVSLPVK